MKKIYFCFVALSIVTMSFGQSLYKKIDFSTDRIIKPQFALKATKHYNTLRNEKALGVVIWENNFDTISQWTIDNDGQNAAGFGWSIDPNYDSWWPTMNPTSFTSTSGGNKAELSNGVPQLTAGVPGTQAFNVTYTLTTASPIDLIALGGTEKVTLSFEQYGARFNDLQEVQISTDGTNFTTVTNNLDKSVLSVQGGSSYPNPDLKQVNLAPFLSPATATAVWIRFSWTTNFPNEASNEAVWITYGWHIDDVKLTTNPTNNLTIGNSDSISIGYPYSQIPSSQIQPISFTAKITNEGIADQPRSFLAVDINNGIFTATSDSTTIISLATDSLFTTSTFTPPGTVGVAYSATMTAASADSIEDIPADNAFTFEDFTITDYTYAMDNGVPDGRAGGIGPAPNNSEELDAGNFYEIVTNDNVSAIQVGVDQNTVVGTFIEGILYESNNGGAFTMIARSATYQVTAADQGNIVTLRLPSNPAVTAGNFYAAAVHAYSEFFYMTAGDSPGPESRTGISSFIFFPDLANPNQGQNFFTRQTPMVRLSFDPALSTEELSNDVSFGVYPNPGNGLFNINLDATGTENVTLSVTNIVGQTVLTENVTFSGSTKENIDLTNYDAGIYLLTINNGEKEKTVKLIVE